MKTTEHLRRASLLSLLAASVAACAYPNVELRLDGAPNNDVVSQDIASDTTNSDGGMDATVDSAPDSTPDSAPDSTPDSAPDSTPDSAPDSAPDSMPDSMPDAPRTNCRMLAYTPSRTAFEANSAGAGMTMMSFVTARDRAVFACRMGCSETCSIPANETDNCRFDAGTNGYVCMSFCSVPMNVFQRDASGCGTAAACWRTAKDAANAACVASSCPGTCTISTNAGDQCEFLGSINGYRCRSTCVCP